jgi:hypothetical protein
MMKNVSTLTLFMTAVAANIEEHPGQELLQVKVTMTYLPRAIPLFFPSTTVSLSLILLSLRPPVTPAPLLHIPLEARFAGAVGCDPWHAEKLYF